MHTNIIYHFYVVCLFLWESCSSKYLQAILKMMPCTPLVSSLVLSPRKSRPVMPSLLTTSLKACVYVICFSEVCFMVLSTRMEFETVSDTSVHQKPMKALRARALSFSSRKLYFGMQWSRQLLVTNQGQCPTIVATAEAMPPWQKAFTPLEWYFSRSIFSPLAPCTCFEVFQASMGRVESRQAPAMTDPREVWTKIGRELRLQEWKMFRESMLAAVSPKRAIGPMIRAGTTPLQNLATPPSPQSLWSVGRKLPPFLNWQFMVVRIHMSDMTCTVIAVPPAMPDLAALVSTSPTSIPDVVIKFIEQQFLTTLTDIEIINSENQVKNGIRLQVLQLIILMRAQSYGKRSKTEQSVQKQLDRMFYLAAEEKLLPKIILDYAHWNQSPKHAHQFRDSVKEVYTKSTTKPLPYNEEQAKTHREKFREKILKLLNNELPIEYLKPVKKDGKYVMTFRGNELEAVKYPTQQQFKVFNDFSESKFKSKYEDIFDDKLEYKHQKLFTSLKRQSMRRAKTKPNEETEQRRIITEPSLTTPVVEIKDEPNNSQLSLPKLTMRNHIEKKQQIPSSSPQKKKFRRIKTADEMQSIAETVRKIGGYSLSQNQIAVTKESITRYLRQWYPRPHRIIDFLQFSDVETLQNYAKIPKRLKLMPMQHIYFMTFLFYDSNNDGYICNNDLIRVEEVAKRCPLLNQDISIIRNGACKVKYENQIKYKDLYRLSEVTEATYFNWLKKQKAEAAKQENPEINDELKDYFGHLNRRKVLIHFNGFKQIYAGEKPYLWYDVLEKISGITYEGLKYK